MVTLGQGFFTEVMAHPIPTDLEAVNVLVASPGAVDLLLWLSHRYFTAKGRESMLDQWLATISEVWPGRPA